MKASGKVCFNARMLNLILCVLFFYETKGQVFFGTQDLVQSGENYFLDASTAFDLSLNPSSVGKGVVFPRVDLTTFVFNVSLLDGYTIPGGFSGMVVYNTGKGQTVSGQGELVNVVPGVYYFDNYFGDPGELMSDVVAGKWRRLLTSCESLVGTPSEVLSVRYVPSLYDEMMGLDFQGVIDNDAHRVVFRIPYEEVNGSYVAFESEIVLGVSGLNGDVNGFKLMYDSGEFYEGGFFEVTLLVQGDGIYTAPKLSIGEELVLVSLPFKINGALKGNLEVKAIGGIPDAKYGDGIHDFIYMPVLMPSGKVWLNNNLGANYANTNHPVFAPQQQAVSITDRHAYGSYYQWGRFSDGHELVSHTENSSIPVNGTVTERSTDVDPGHSFFILDVLEPFDWKSPSSGGVWGGSGVYINNPCPSGFKVPGIFEFENEKNVSGLNNMINAFNSPLKLSASGYRDQAYIIEGTDTIMRYWTSSSSPILGASRCYNYNASSALSGVQYRMYASSVRCVKQ